MEEYFKNKNKLAELNRMRCSIFEEEGKEVGIYTHGGFIFYGYVVVINDAIAEINGTPVAFVDMITLTEKKEKNYNR